MIITYLGHAAFLILTQNGTRLITDPYNAAQYGDSFRYKAIEEIADIVTVSHDHNDHNFHGIKGDPQYIEELGHWDIDSVVIDGYASFHDDCQGKQRGENRIFAIHADGLSLVHLGDLGHPLSPEQVQKIGAVDILMIPVGGTYTIDAATARDIVAMVNPKIVIPMHYLTDRCSFPIQPVDDFIKDVSPQKFSEGVKINKHDLPDSLYYYVLEPTH